MIDLRYGKHVIHSLREIPKGSVHEICTSPPYYGLRDYNLPPIVWGGDERCLHEWGTKQGRFCKCGAWLGHLGLEPTPQQYIANIVSVATELYRVLRDDGAFWLNLGDSFASGAGTCKTPGLKHKDMIGVPWQVAFALRDAGWYLRGAMPWIKRNPMPDSVQDRPATTIEYVFLFTKSPRYFYDAEAVKQPSTGKGGGASFGKQDSDTNGTKAQSRQYDRPDYQTRSFRSADLFFKSWQGLLNDEGGDPLAFVVNLKSYKGAHFAVWPEMLVDPMIRAGTSEKGCCGKCGSQLMRQTAAAESKPHPRPGRLARPDIDDRGGNQANGDIPLRRETITVGWERSCSCKTNDIAPCVVLDPFCGSGTTMKVAADLGRDGIGLDLSGDYLDLARERLKGHKIGSVLGAAEEARAQPSLF